MISITGILSLLSALTATSGALLCTTCVSTTSSSCSGDNVTCPTVDQCGTLYIETTTGGPTSKGFVRQCIPSSECNVKGSISIKEGQIKLVSSCCNIDGCIPTDPSVVVPTQSSDPNGVVCPSCSSSNSASCDSTDTIQCTGNENMCLLQTTKTTGSGSSAYRGCATKSICDVGRQSQSVEGVKTQMKFFCTGRGISVHTASLTPAIACLLLLIFVLLTH